MSNLIDILKHPAFEQQTAVQGSVAAAVVTLTNTSNG
jgi:hypothetical protein